LRSVAFAPNGKLVRVEEDNSSSRIYEKTFAIATVSKCRFLRFGRSPSAGAQMHESGCLVAQDCEGRRAQCAETAPPRPGTRVHQSISVRAAPEWIPSPAIPRIRSHPRPCEIASRHFSRSRIPRPQRSTESFGGANAPRDQSSDISHCEFVDALARVVKRREPP
jgi:hypothetical protein